MHTHIPIYIHIHIHIYIYMHPFNNQLFDRRPPDLGDARWG